jgi:hypothetical protein
MLVLSATSQSGNTPETARVPFKTATYADAKEAFELNFVFLVVDSDVSDSQATLRDTARFRVFLKLEQNRKVILPHNGSDKEQPLKTLISHSN